MKRYLAVALALGLLAGMMGFPAEAAKRKKKPTVRVLELPYDQPAIGVGGVGGSCPAGACPTIATANETYAVIQIVDDLSPSGYVTLAYDQDGDGIQDLGAGPSVCGATAEAVPMEPVTSYTAWSWVAGIECPGSSSTSGTIKVFLSNNAAAAEKAAAKG